MGKEPDPSRPATPRPRRPALLLIGGTFLALLVLQWVGVRTPMPKEVPFSVIAGHLAEGRLARVRISATAVRAELTEAPPGEVKLLVATRMPDVDLGRFADEVRAKGVELSGDLDAGGMWVGILLSWLLPFALIASLWWYAARRAGRSGPLSFGKNKARIVDRNQGERVTFADVAGVDEAKAELVEIVDCLTDPGRYRALGARPPKGVLLVGPPGTGKTLLARAVAGEANVPFFTISGSDFVEMFVGVGAARMRDLFVQAKERAPCIVFIDEIDAVGKSRAGAAALASNDEREQTLDALLVEMDGFDGGAGVVLMAATNRPDVLDPALLRPGRFDRQVVVDRPDVRGREAILVVHAKRVRTGGSVDLAAIAARTPGRVGADLANVVNEAAIAAARRRGEAVQQQDFEEAIDRLQLGLKKSGGMMNAAEKRRVAFHEAGHALVALSVQHADPVHRVSIIPRSIGALGHTLQLPVDDRHLMTRPELLDRVCVLLGGRVAEELVFAEASTGAESDLERATAIARAMIARYGMGEGLGTVSWSGDGERRHPLLGGDPLSEHTARRIDEEMLTLVEGERTRARRLLEQRRPALERLAAALLDHETVEREELARLAEG